MNLNEKVLVILEQVGAGPLAQGLLKLDTGDSNP